MTPAEHRAEAERLTDVANALQFRALQNRHDHPAALYLSTMAHAKRLQAQWHERRIRPDLELLSRPLALGAVRNIAPVLVGDHERIYRINDFMIARPQ